MPIPLEKLRAIKTIVTHRSCPDGVASAMILVNALPNANVLFVDYNTPEIRDLPATEGLIFCDFSPPANRAAEFVAAGAIVLDHHKTARDVVAGFGDLGVFGDEETDPGVSGAVLAMRHVWQPLRSDSDTDHRIVWNFATLAGIRDTWQNQNPRWREACAQAEALEFYQSDAAAPAHELIFASPKDWAAPLAIGGHLLKRRAERVQTIINEAYWCDVHDLRVAIVPTRSTSDAMDVLSTSGCDVLMGFAYRAEGSSLRLQVSCRSRGVDVATFAKSFGGGGHTRAAGFTLSVSLGQTNPYTLLVNLLDTHLIRTGHGAL